MSWKKMVAHVQCERDRYDQQKALLRVYLKDEEMYSAGGKLVLFSIYLLLIVKRG